MSDHGFDMEIEFKSDAGEATGRKAYLQLKSGDSHPNGRAMARRSSKSRKSATPAIGWSRLSRDAGDPKLRGRNPLDGSAGLSEAAPAITARNP